MYVFLSAIRAIGLCHDKQADIGVSSIIAFPKKIKSEIKAMKLRVAIIYQS